LVERVQERLGLIYFLKGMIRLLRSKRLGPTGIIGLLWPLALLAPFVPGLPRPELSGLPWRQELVLALLLVCTAASILLRRGLNFPPSFRFKRRYIILAAPLLLFTFWSAASLAWAANPYPVLHHTFVWGAYLLFFLLMRRVAESPRLLSASLTAFAAAIFIISLATVVGAMGASLSLFRNNGLGEPMAVSLPLLTALAMHLRRRGVAILCGATALLAWLAMLQAHERTPFLSTMAGLVLLALMLFAFPRFRSRVKLLRTAALLACFILAAALQFMPSLTSGVVAEPPFTVYSRLQSTNAGDENTLARILFWNAALEMVREHPATGVGANNYAIDYPEARARFVAAHPDSKLAGMLEWHLAGVAHNEYLQILAELGAVGFLFFAFFALGLIFTAWLALRRARSPLAPGAISSLAVFAISSGASSISFRWLASGLIFFFAAALVARLADRDDEKEASVSFSPFWMRGATATAFLFTLLMLCGMGAQALSVTRSGQAQEAVNASRAEELFRDALFWNPLDGATHFTYGQWLYQHGRYNEAVPHLRIGLRNGISTSLCYAYLSSAEIKTGEMSKAEATLDEALKIYPRSIFLHVRRASLLSGMGKREEADAEMSLALALNAPTARGWWMLITEGKEAATRAAREKPLEVSAPGSLNTPEAAFFVLMENGEAGQSFARNSEPQDSEARKP
jgi:O-antigen ligase